MRPNLQGVGNQTSLFRLGQQPPGLFFVRARWHPKTCTDLKRRELRDAIDAVAGEPRTCSPDTNVAAAAALMLDGDCGIPPVVADGKLVGVITDRDMCIALATRNKLASEIAVHEVVQTPIYTCGPDDDVQAALETMKQHCV
jgi:CBS domain-containing protein